VGLELPGAPRLRSGSNDAGADGVAGVSVGGAGGVGCALAFIKPKADPGAAGGMAAVG
jgi:hypothetical protein